jgi:leader peptidase (prepilin peptidase)/N-methyltransferase
VRVHELALGGLVGLAVGSFLNVVVWRLPRGESLVSPGSRCPRCGTPIRWFDNLPVLSWLLLRGRCRACRGAISPRYPLVEALTGALFVLALQRFGDQDLLAAGVVASVLAALVAVSVVDLDLRIIPDRITRPFTVLALPLAVLTAETLHGVGWVRAAKPGMNALLHAGAGILAGLFAILLVRWIGRLVFRKEAMGLGDAKLLAMIGGFVGPLGVLYALILACLGGSLVHGLVVAFTARRPKPLRLELRGAGGIRREFGAGRLRPGRGTGRFRLEVEAEAAGPEAGSAADLRFVLPAVRVLADEDVEVRARGRFEASTPAGGAHRWSLELETSDGAGAESLALFAASHKYLPFGPYLALGGAVTLLWQEQVRWLVGEAYPRWVHSLLGG